MSDTAAVELALGRIFGMMQRPTEPGDAAEYERCRSVVLDVLAPGTDPLPMPYRPSIARQFGMGAAGQS